jgi:multimeric flavodoxin WrbA
MTDNTVLILIGSPRRLGNSAALAEQIAAGANSAGAQVETFFLQDLSIQPCDGCDACHDNPGSGCILEDDMQKLYPKLHEAAAIVIATPIYWFTMSAQTKLCIDRWYALEEGDGNALMGKRFAVALAYGDSDPYNSGAVNAIRSFQDMCRYLKANLVGIVYGSASDAGEIKQNKELMEKAFRLGKKLAQS